MKNIIFLVSSVLIFAAFNFSIYSNEQIKTNGETVFLLLGTADPRSLMQGDYMTLRYRIGDEHVPAEQQKSGFAVIGLDEKKVAVFKRLYGGEKLEAGEKLLRYHAQYYRVRIVPDTFMFQEGHARLYAQARYGVFKFGASGKYLLVGLADEHFKMITAGYVPEPPAPAPPPASAPPAPAPAEPPAPSAPQGTAP